MLSVFLRESVKTQSSVFWPPKGKTARNLSGTKNRKKIMAALESRGTPRAEGVSGKIVFLRVSQALDRGV